jgi:hypothetical protein
MAALGFSFIDNNESKNIEQSTKKHSRTLRKRHKKKSSKIDNLLNSLSANRVPEGKECDDDDYVLANFKPLTEDSQTPTHQNSTELTPATQGDNGENGQLGVTQENFAQLGEVTDYKQYVPYYTQLQGSQEEIHANKDSLMTKLNYMIHLLEEQQDEKTNNVTEELVLYLFLGVFVIFVVDSFARVGKYKR